MTLAPDAAERLRATIAPLVTGDGLVLEDLQVRRVGTATTVEVVVDLPEDELGSVDLDTLATLTRAVSDHLDGQDAVLGEDPYELEVTTPGAERPLTAPRHFRRARTRLLALRTRDGKDLTARLVGISDDDVLTLHPETAPGAKPSARRKPLPDVELPLADVASAKVLLEFSRPSDAVGGTGSDDATDTQDDPDHHDPDDRDDREDRENEEG